MKEKIIKEWFERGERDFGAAKIIIYSRILL